MHTEKSIAARLDRLPVSSFHYRILFLIAAGIFLDGFEIAMAASVLGDLLHSGWSTPYLNALFISATFAGFIIGAWGSGFIADKYGRRLCYQINLALFGFSSLIAAFAPNMSLLIVLRFIMGMGLGGELVLGYATLAEFVPPRKRGRLVALLSCIAQSAIFFAALLAMFIIPTLGWRWMFAIAGIASVIIWLMRKTMPESPRWLACKGKFAQADAIIAPLEQAHGLSADEASHAERQSAAVNLPASGVKAPLFARKYLPPLLIGTVIMCTIQMCLYGFVSWLPTFFIQLGYDIKQSLQWNLLMTLGGPLGGLLALLLVERVGRKPLLIASAMVAIVISGIYISVSSPLLAAFFGMLMLIPIYVIVVVGQAIYMPELFPTDIRMRGNGFCSAIARLFAVAIPMVIPAIFAFGGIRAVVCTVCVFLLLLAITMMFMAKETRKRSLEEITG
ncbi:MFS transporter [Pluralibacter gergoviae]|uniref:MFS transporter n=1 Tax=Pluralibacter gergoviae TaxID=61647 RepID=UPI0005EC45ED|nr:MFS transporter [Pluralibacter gergoviae]KJM65499.1 hypothetical protein SS31_06445 [Pluralibacter gergoviae]OUR03815.1 MFS transporter [Pluralibacter gergoviae]